MKQTLEEEGQRIRGKVGARRTFEDLSLEDCQLKEGETRTYLGPKTTQVKDHEFKSSLRQRDLLNLFQIFRKPVSEMYFVIWKSGLMICSMTKISE